MATESMKLVLSTGQCNLPDIDIDTAVFGNVTVPRNRKTLFLAVSNDVIHDGPSDELSFSALSAANSCTFQLLLYLTYCCKGTVFQVTLEYPDVAAMSTPIREDHAHGRLFCFVLDMDGGDSTPNADTTNAQADSSQPGSTIDNYLQDLLDTDVGVFQGYNTFDHSDHAADDEEVQKQAFNAFMRLQLVRKKVSSLNNAMVVMKDEKNELSAVFDWIDIVADSWNSNKLDKKIVKDLQGSLYTPFCQSRKPAIVLPQSIAGLSLRTLAQSVRAMTDMCPYGEGLTLFRSIIASLGPTQWLKQSIMDTYNPDVPRDVAYLDTLNAFALDLAKGSQSHVSTRGLIVFKYALDKLIEPDAPDLFCRSMLHKHVPVNKSEIDSVLKQIRSKRSTQQVARMLDSGSCSCNHRESLGADNAGCAGQCYFAYACYYNYTDKHPFIASKCDHSYRLAHLHPHLGKLERMSKEMKEEYTGSKQFELIADMVFTMLTSRKFGERDSIYVGLTRFVDEALGNSSLSLGHHLPNIHQRLCRRLFDYHGDHDAVKVYDAAVVKHLFCDSMEVTRLFQASTTFNYIITNTAPRYTVERIMLLNITGPGEGKSYANNLLEYQFQRVAGCIERLTSFTMMAFKYKQNRTSCVVIIDDAHISHEKNAKSIDKESNVIPNTFKNLLDTSTLESDVVTKDPATGKIATVKYKAVHNCGFVWNTNTMSFMSDAWADRCLIMESEHPKEVSTTRSTTDIVNAVKTRNMDVIAALCLYRQNLIQSATMIADSDVMQFSVRFDKARDACVAAFYRTHIECAGMVGRRVSSCINQLVFAEAMKLACHFVFDIWIPPWTEIPDNTGDTTTFMRRLNANRMEALNKLSFGQLCLETNAVYKLCTAACLPDICPRALDSQGRFACKVLGYVLTQVHEQQLKTSIKNDTLSISGVEDIDFPTKHKDNNEPAHEMIMLCSTCKVPTRSAAGDRERKTRKLCTYRLSHSQLPSHVKRGRAKPNRKVSSVSLSLEMVYDMFAIYAPDSHSGFWIQVTSAMTEAYENTGDNDEDVGNAMGQYHGAAAAASQPQCPMLSFTLDFTADPLRSLVLEATAGVKPLDELTFNRCALGDETFQCSAPLYYGAVLLNALGESAPDLAYNERHVKESRCGPRGTFHGPRLTVYSGDYAGVPVKNMSSFCATRTTYHQDQLYLRKEVADRDYIFELEEDWEWKDACDVLNRVYQDDIVTVGMLKEDYAVTMVSMSRPGATVPTVDGARALALRTHARDPIDTPRRVRQTQDTSQRPGRTGKHSQKRKHLSQSSEHAESSDRGSHKKHRLVC